MEISECCIKEQIIDQLEDFIGFYNEVGLNGRKIYCLDEWGIKTRITDISVNERSSMFSYEDIEVTWSLKDIIRNNEPIGKTLKFMVSGFGFYKVLSKETIQIDAVIMFSDLDEDRLVFN